MKLSYSGQVAVLRWHEDVILTLSESLLNQNTGLSTNQNCVSKSSSVKCEKLLHRSRRHGVGPVISTVFVKQARGGCD